MTIAGCLAPGIHDIPTETYHADPCPEPSLRSSHIEPLLEKTPADVRLDHPRLAPPTDADLDEDDEPRKETKAQRLGTLVHKLILGQGREIVVCDYADWRSGAAKADRAKALAEGCTPALTGEVKLAERITAAALPQLQAKFGAWPLGASEQALIWRRKTAHGPIYGRALVDHLSADLTLIVDLKTTALALDDESLAKKFASEGSAYQACWNIEGVETLHPELAGRVKFRHAVIGVKPPYHVRRIAIPEPWLHMARRRIDRAADTFARCLHAGDWPGYPEQETTLNLPGWMERKWLEEEMEGEAA